MSRILVVEDEPIVRLFLAEGLTEAGHLVTTATNGAEALDRALEEHLDIVLLDLLLPVMDGFTFLRERLSHPDLVKVPVIVLSAAGISGLRRATKLRATAVLAKPLDLDVLSAVIEHVMQPRPLLEPDSSGTSQPLGTCPVCGLLAHAQLDPEQAPANPIAAIHAARTRHVLAHSSGDIARVPLRQRLLQLPTERRTILARWFYYNLRQDWGDQDAHGVHTIDAVLDSPALHRLWHGALSCADKRCRHGTD